VIEMEQYLGRNIMWVPADRKTGPLSEQVRSSQVKELSPSGKHVLLEEGSRVKWYPTVSIHILEVLD
jgi:hypothetical protein